MKKSNLAPIFNSDLNTIDSFLIIVISMISFMIKYHLIFHPDGCVFDEVYFGNFTNYYIKSQFYYDIHPPLAKMVAFLFANLSEYDGSINFSNAPVYKNPDYVFLRIIPATFSALCAPLAYISVKFSGFSSTAATVSALLIAFDTSLGTEGRHILSDGILHFFSMLHIAVLMYTFSMPPYDKKFNCWHVLTGISLGAACSCKNTAWGLMALDAFVYVFTFLPILKIGIFDYLFQVGFYGATLAILMLLVYFISFSIHLFLLPYAGPGEPYLSEQMKRQLISNSGVEAALFAKRLLKPNLFKRSLWLTINMHMGNMGIKQFHDSMSFPSQWPILSGVMCYFWSKDGNEIRCLGNVFSYYLCLIGIILCCLKPGKNLASLRFVIGWAVCYFPFYLIPRVMYQYHYCIPLMIGCMAFGCSLDIYLPKKTKQFVACICIILVIFGFYLWSPYVYGTKLHDRDIAIWTKRWIDGDSDHQSRRASYYAEQAHQNE